MPPAQPQNSTFATLGDTNLDDEDIDDDIDTSDLRARYEVQLEKGYDCHVVIDGLPEVNEEQKPKLVKFLLKKLRAIGRTSETQLDMPMGPDGKSLRFAFAEFATSAEAAAAVRGLHGQPLDKKHTLLVNKLTDIARYGEEGRIDEKFVAPVVPPFEDQEHLRSFLADPSGRGRDQFVQYRGDSVGVFWNNDKEKPENIVDRQRWTDLFCQWSPLGTYLVSVHQQGIQLWGGESWLRKGRFPHDFVELVAFSPSEKYLVTWSSRPISIPEDGSHPALTFDDDGKNYVIWDIETTKPLRSFANNDVGGEDESKPRKVPWPAFKWSSDDKYVARLNHGQSISVYELPGMGLLGKTTIKIDGVMDFEWSPSTATREGVRGYEQLLCFWTPEIASSPAKVGIMSLPSRQIVRSLNLFSVSDAKLHWQSEGSYLCVKVDRHSKSKKSLATTLEIFRIKEKGVPVEVVDAVKDTVINFAWEPKGDRFVLISTADASTPAGAPPKTSVSFFCPEKTKGQIAGNFRLLKTLEKKSCNAIYWSPRGRFVVLASIHGTHSSSLEFYDVEFEGDKPESDKDLTGNLQLMNNADHYGVTDVEWDPSGRFVATWASIWKHGVENGYHLYDFKGELLREEHIDKFKQWSWRPRPPSLLTKDEQKAVRKNLREYSRVFEQEDAERGASADLAVVEERRRLLSEWIRLRAELEAEAESQRRAMGWPDDMVNALLSHSHVPTVQDDEEVMEEIVEEVLEEHEEIVQGSS